MHASIKHASFSVAEVSLTLYTHAVSFSYSYRSITLSPLGIYSIIVKSPSAELIETDKLVMVDIIVRTENHFIFVVRIASYGSHYFPIN